MTDTPLPSMRIIYFSNQSPEAFLVQTGEGALLIVNYRRVE